MITLPTSPTLGQVYVADNGATYTWLGNRWSSIVAIQSRTADFFYDGGYSADMFADTTLDGGGA